MIPSKTIQSSGMGSSRCKAGAMQDAWRRCRVFAILLASWPALGNADDTSIQLKKSGYLEAGVMHHSLSDGYGTWNGQFVRGVLHDGGKNTWNAEVVRLSEFDDHGMLFVLGNTHEFSPLWFTQVGLSGSSGGFFLPRLRIDAAVNRKWLERQNLVTSLGVTLVDAKDEHRDHSVSLGAAYYFEQPWVVEGGIRFNRSNPGGVYATSQFAAVTYGEDKRRYLTLRYGFGSEAYQLVGEGTAINDFRSHVTTFTWREWVRNDRGFQLRLENYSNPYFGRNGVELGAFGEF